MRISIALKAALLMSSALVATPALAQQQPTPPEHYTLDPRGVDLVTGALTLSQTDVVIGDPSDGGLVHGRIYTNGGWRDMLSGTISILGSTYTVSLGGISEIFVKSGSTYTAVSNTGATLTETSGQYNFTSADGTKATYGIMFSGAVSPYQAFDASLLAVTKPNGEVTTLVWSSITYCGKRDINTDECLIYSNAVRLEGARNNRGYLIKYDYGMDAEPQNNGEAFGLWLSRTKATGVNLAVDYCHLGPGACSGLTRTWPSMSYVAGDYGGDIGTATDQSSRTTTYTYGPDGLLTVRSPGSSVDDLAVTYASSRVASVASAAGTWNYSYSTVGSTRTTTASGPLGQALSAVSNLTIGRATSVTQTTSVSPAASSTWGYQYDGQARLTRTTNPEGDYTEVTYDTRGNVTQSVSVAKSGSGLANITTSATYPSTCANPVTCNLPTTTTDARGNVTNYTYDSTHGGVLSVTAPAPSGGADRPETRIAYAAQTAYYKNSGGTIVAAPSAVTLPVEVSACATGTSCDAAANEVLTTVGYGSSGVANNLQPATVSNGSGASPSMAVTAMTYTPNGDVETVDGPLSGTADTTRYRYDDARQRVGVVAPDPDGGGARPNPAQRMTYTPRGQVTLVEAGTTAGQGDPAWAAFATDQKAQTTYDSYGRAVEVRQMSAASAVSGVQQVSYDAAGRVDCQVVRMNTATFGSLPGSACTAATTGSDGPDRISRVTYDAAGRPVSTTRAYGLAEAVTESLTYTANGQAATMTDGNGNVSIAEYDGHDRPAKLRYPNPTGGGTSTTDYTEVGYDAASNVVSQRDRAGQTTTVAYDNLNRPTTIDAPSGTMDVALTYDNLGRTLISVGNGQTLTNVWDPLSRLTSETTAALSTMSYEYDAAGRMTRITWPDTVYAQYDHDVLGATTAIRLNGASSGADVLATYAFDSQSRLSGITRGNGASSTYGYDAWGRMNALSHDLSGSGNDVAYAFTWNPGGQIASRTTSNATYVASASANASYAHDGLNRMTTVNGGGLTYDSNQNITGALGDTYGYDAANRLTSATIGGTGYSFIHDPAGRLFASPGERYQYAGDQLVTEYNAVGDFRARHIPGPGLDQPVATLFVDGSRYQQLADERGSVVALTDASAVAAGINTYDEYGVATASDRFQYTGQAFLAPGLYNYRARVYAPQLGRFLQTDPIGYAAGANLYGYVSADPVNLSDPTGTVMMITNCSGGYTVPGSTGPSSPDNPGDLERIYLPLVCSYSGGGPTSYIPPGSTIGGGADPGHEFEEEILVCRNASALTPRQRANLLARHPYPGHNSRSPIRDGDYGVARANVSYSLINGYSITMPGIGGLVQTDISNDGLRLVNTATRAHFFSGTTTRGYFERGGALYSYAIGVGTNRELFDQMNEIIGPIAFRQLLERQAKATRDEVPGC